MEETYVILVDEKDNQTGVMEKMRAHIEARLHRAVSVFILNSRGEWILQKRALDKYHSRGLWTNTCCTHPFPGEPANEAAQRRLLEEMGIKCDIKEIFSFVYKEELDDNLTEYEFDHVFIGMTDEIPVINTDEVLDWKSISFKDMMEDIQARPSDYTAWFRRIYLEVQNYLLDKKQII
jgi:isopentenyl-diphosphate delta-isomerase